MVCNVEIDSENLLEKRIITNYYKTKYILLENY